MKKIVLPMLMITLAFMSLGCQNPMQSTDIVTYTVTYSTEKGTAPSSITVVEDSILTEN